jgi:hypothetical protein
MCCSKERLRIRVLAIQIEDLKSFACDPTF